MKNINKDDGFITIRGKKNKRYIEEKVNGIDTFGQYVKKMRQDAGCTQIVFAEKHGVHQSYISSIEQENHKVTYKSLRVACRVFNLNFNKMKEKFLYNHDCSIKDVFNLCLENNNNIKEILTILGGSNSPSIAKKDGNDR